MRGLTTRRKRLEGLLDPGGQLRAEQALGKTIDKIALPRQRIELDSRLLECAVREILTDRVASS